MKIGILAYQGGVFEHRYMVERACEELGYDCDIVLVTKVHHLKDVDAIILPGGESTTISKLAKRFGVLDELRKLAMNGIPTFGTCAGAILLAKHVIDRVTGKVLRNPVGIMDMDIVRNYYGRQRESFEVDLAIPILGNKPFRGVFIRAPAITRIGPHVTSLAMLNDVHVAVQQGPHLATTFHPELTNDTRFHKYFLKIVKH